MKPFTYHVEVSGFCNLKCPSCPQGNSKQVDHTRCFMGVNLFRKIIGKIAHEPVSVKRVSLFNWGEVFLHSQLAELISIVKSHNLFCHLSSNFNQINNLEGVIAARPDALRISISGFTNDTYQRTHRKGNIEIVKKNMILLRKVLNSYASQTVIEVNYHKYLHNTGKELSEMSRFATNLGFSFTTSWAYLMPMEKNLAYFMDNLSQQDKRLIDMLAIKPDLLKKICLPFSETDCKLRSNQTAINSNGSVALCCATFNSKYNISDNFLQISHEDLQKLKNLHPLCGECMSHGIHMGAVYEPFDAIDRAAQENVAAFNKSIISISQKNKDSLNALPTKTCFTRRYGVQWPVCSTTAAVKQGPKTTGAPVLPGASAAPSPAAPPLVSVIVSTLNHQDMLVTALQSVLSQTYQHHEIIVVNDGGLGVNPMAGWLKQQKDITYVRHDRPRGLAAARNTGIKISRGKYIAYLNDDEILYPDHLQSLATFLETSDFEVAYTDAARAWQEKKLGRYEVTKREPCPAGDYDPDDLLVGNVAPALCVMHARACLTTAGAFDETLTALADWDLWIRLSRQYPFARLKQITCETSRRPEDSATAEGNGQNIFVATEMIYDKYRQEVRDKPEIEKRRQDYLEKFRKSLVAGKPYQATQMAGTEARPIFVS
jgi:MoaA/NifB/PqqE/SkfB family radical SAM enzyme